MKTTLIHLFVFLGMFTPANSQDLCTICQKFKNNVVQITATFNDGKEENGFGTVIAERDNRLYIVTAKHVLYDIDDKGFASIDNKTKSVTVKFFSDQGKEYRANLLKLPANKLDISLLEVEKPKNYSWTKEFYSRTIQTGTKVWFIGRSGQWYIPTGSSVGSVNDFTSEDEILIDINSIQPGTSGSPLISADGMVGLIFEDAAGGAKAYTIEKVRQLITKTWNYPWQISLKTNLAKPETEGNINADEMINIPEKLAGTWAGTAYVVADGNLPFLKLHLVIDESEKINTYKSYMEMLGSTSGNLLLAESYLSVKRGLKLKMVGGGSLYGSKLKFLNENSIHIEGIIEGDVYGQSQFPVIIELKR